jgi:hypothetical protein
MSREEQENEKIEMEREEEKLKGVKRRIEIEKKKREAKQRDIMETRVKVSYSMPLWLREKINDESLKLGLYQWEYIAKMIEKAEICPDIKEVFEVLNMCCDVLTIKILEISEGRIRNWNMDYLIDLKDRVLKILNYIVEMERKQEKK